MKSKSSSKKKPATPRKKAAKKPVKKSAKKPVKKVAKKAPAKKRVAAKKTAHGMNEFQQCVLLAAIINQHRAADPHIQQTPLPDINSSILAPLREHLAQYTFTADDIMRAATDLLRAKEFKQFFSIEKSLKQKICVSGTNPKVLMGQLLELADSEARKTIYLSEKDPHDIHKTTLEKHALKTGQIDHTHLAAIQQERPDSHLAHKKIIIKLNFDKMGRSFLDNIPRLSTKQRRGRG